VKIRGFRIELGEIEAQLARLPGVNEAIVLAREAEPWTDREREHLAQRNASRERAERAQRDEPGEKRLVGYLTGEGLDLDAIRMQLKASLPEYMVPGALVVLDKLPLTPNGKVDRKALPAPELSAYAAKKYEPPQGDIELALATMWQELLHVERVGRGDNFFELGGHSLLATKFVSHVQHVLGLDLTLRELFEAPTLQAVAIRLSLKRRLAFGALARVPSEAQEMEEGSL
jgi:hypothetical protein